MSLVEPIIVCTIIGTIIAPFVLYGFLDFLNYIEPYLVSFEFWLKARR